MKKFIFITALGLIIGMQTSLASTNFASSINRIIASTDPNLNAGIIIKDPTTERILVQINSNRLFIPASNMKLFTTFAALKTLGPNFVFQTLIYADLSKLENGVLTGNVYLQFNGDPSLTHEQLNQLIAALSHAGIQKINGNFVLINQGFDNVDYGPGWMWDDANYCDGEAITGMIVDHNCFSAIISPAAQLNMPAVLQVKNSILPFNISNQVTTVGTATNCEIVVKSDDKNNFVIQGCVNQANDNQKKLHQVDIAIRNINLYVAQLVQRLLQNNHIVLNGEIQLGALDTDSAKPLLVVNSNKLPAILATMLKKSDNLYANVLFKKIGQVSTGQLGTWQNSATAVKNLIQAQLGINPKSWVMVDGSGTSRYDLVTPNQILILLGAVYKDPTLANAFIPALPVSGVDGTLEFRMTNPEMKGRVKAKTGSMTGVSALSGYLKITQTKTLIFVMLMNNFIGTEDTYRSVQDKILGSVYVSTMPAINR